MKLTRLFVLHFFTVTLICCLINPITPATIKSKTTETKKSDTANGATSKKSTSSHTIIRPTNIFKTKEELDSMTGSNEQRDIRPFEWLYQHLNEYLMCVYGGHKDCEHKLASAVNTEEMNNKLNQLKKQNEFQQYQMRPRGPMNFGPKPPNPPMGSPDGSMMWGPHVAGGPAPGPFMMGPHQPYYMNNKMPYWKSQSQGSMMEGPKYPGPMGPLGPMNFEPKQPQPPMSIQPMLMEQRQMEQRPMEPMQIEQMPHDGGPNGESMPMLLSFRGQQQQQMFPRMNKDFEKNNFIEKMDQTSKKENTDDSEKNRENKWMRSDNQYPGMMPSPMFGIPNFVAQ